MTITYDKIETTLDELKNVDRTNPYNVVGEFIRVISDYNDKDFYDKIQFLQGEFQPMSGIMKQNIKDRMTQNNKYPYIGKSYFKGATPDNDYTPSTPYQIEVEETPYTNSDEGYKKLCVRSGGADSPRPITLRLAKDNNYYVWSDSFMGLLSDIRQPESSNPWA